MQGVQIPLREIVKLTLINNFLIHNYSPSRKPQDRLFVSYKN